MRVTLSRLFLRVLAGLLLAASVCALPARAQGTPGLALLLPDAQALSDPRVGAWLDAAAEEGLQLAILRESQFLAAGNALSGLILPDQIYQRAGDAVVAAIQQYASRGGVVMLVYDFGALTDTGLYPVPKSRLSALAGVDYVLYDELRDLTIGLGPVNGLESRLWQLQVPPGKAMPYPPAGGTGSLVELPLYLPSGAGDPGGLKDYDAAQYHRFKGKKHQDFIPAKAIRGPRGKGGRYAPVSYVPGDTPMGVSGYVYGLLRYPSFVTRGTYAGDVMLASPDFGLQAGYQPYGSGGVLFVNLPLSYLKGQTDGMLMHGFLRYFGDSLLRLPRLANVPDGVGGLTLNWHVDDAAAIDAIDALDGIKKLNLWKGGPFSIHVTAGPDVNAFGDGLGVDLLHNKRAAHWMRQFDRHGHQVGSHGGWIHNVFGPNATEYNANAVAGPSGETFFDLLKMNVMAIESVLGHRLLEYSAPQGNTPLWSLDWLQGRGFAGYYFTGDTGMGPTRAYRPLLAQPGLGALQHDKLWAFPVTPFGVAATFEEFAELGIGSAEVGDWLVKLVDFSVVNRTNRLIYFHPAGAVTYADALATLIGRADQYANARNAGYRWYTMADLADFNSKRQQVSWTFARQADGSVRFSASHPSDLDQQTWVLPKAAYARPVILAANSPGDWSASSLGARAHAGNGKGGNMDAVLREDAANWYVTAQAGVKSLEFVSLSLAH